MLLVSNNKDITIDNDVAFVLKNSLARADQIEAVLVLECMKPEYGGFTFGISKMTLGDLLLMQYHIQDFIKRRIESED